MIIALLLVASGGLLARLWVMQQYYVGSTDDRVVIFQGVRGSVLGWDLHEEVERVAVDGVDLRVSDLQENARTAVQDGILSTDGLAGARDTAERLGRDRMLPECPKPEPIPPVVPGTPVPGAQPSPTVIPPTTSLLPSIPPEPGKTCRQAG